MLRVFACSTLSLVILEGPAPAGGGQHRHARPGLHPGDAYPVPGRLVRLGTALLWGAVTNA